MTATLFAFLPHAGHDTGAHHYLLVLAAAAVGFTAGLLCRKLPALAGRRIR